MSSDGTNPAALPSAAPVHPVSAAPAYPFSAEEILALHDIPLFTVHSLAVYGGFVEVVGMALPPQGDPAAVAFRADAGAAISVEYPLEHPWAADYYWYWPGSANSRFRLRLDLAKSRTAADYYTFRIVFSEGESRPLEHLRTAIVVPKDLGRLEVYPRLENLRRVQRNNTMENVTTTGMSDCRRVVELGKHYGWDGAGSVLDWGVGHGRLARHFDMFAPQAEIFGSDIDPDNIRWLQQALPRVRGSVGPLMPPSQFADDQFSLIYGISVMTHLERSVQRAWLEEIRRILRPGGIALLTFTGDTSVAFASKWLDRGFYDAYKQTGAGPDLPCEDLVGVIDTPEYYKNVLQNLEITRALCAEHLDVLDACECMFGYQDLLVLRKS